MSPGETITRSPLDKPLHQLTEDDISQLTREDCRRYLKEKGMRRPSWNKSQAIQQVISLKSLLETTTDSDGGDAAGARKKLYIPRPEIPHHRVTLASDASEKGTRDDSRNSVLAADDLIPYRRQDQPKADFSSDRSDRLANGDIDSVSPRTIAATDVPDGQMTIFYCGKVNVYDDVPSEKARTIMQLAASPLHFPPEIPDGFAALGPHPGPVHGQSVKVAPGSPMAIFPTLQPEGSQLRKEEGNIPREDNQEGPGSRKASVKRYLEKRKDRFKRKVAMSPSASLDIYLNNRVGDRSPSEQLSRSDACSPPHPKLPHITTQCSSVENITGNANRSADLSYKDDEER